MKRRDKTFYATVGRLIKNGKISGKVKQKRARRKKTK